MDMGRAIGWGCRCGYCAMSLFDLDLTFDLAEVTLCDIDLTFDLAVITLMFKILSWLYLRNHKIKM